MGGALPGARPKRPPGASKPLAALLGPIRRKKFGRQAGLRPKSQSAELLAGTAHPSAKGDPRQARVCILTSAHPPFDPRIFHKEAKSLVRGGYTVTLVAPHTRDEVVDSIRVRAVPKPASRLARMVTVAPRVLLEACRERANIYHFHDPELIPAGLALRLLGASVIYDVHEDYPRQILAKTYLPNWLRPLVARAFQELEQFAAARFSAVVVASPSQLPRLARVNNRTICVRNLVDLNSFPVSSTPASLSTRRAWVVYAGLLAENRAVLEMVEAMGLLPDHLNARLELAGPAEPGLYDRMARLPGWQRVDFHGYMSRDGVAQLLDCARVGLELSYPEEHYLDAWPTKMFEYMAAGIPTVATDMPLYRELFGAPGCALLVDPKKPAAIAEAIHFLLTHDDEAQAMGRRGRALVEAHYQWSTEAQHLLACYGALGPTRGPDPKQPTIAPESRRGPWAGTGA